MNILIDTNILIPLEDTSKVLDEKFAVARKLSSEQGHILYLHPIQTSDIQNDLNANRREIMLSRISQYPVIPSPPLPSHDDIEKINGKSQIPMIESTTQFSMPCIEVLFSY